MNKELVIFESGELKLEVPFTPETDNVWLTSNQMDVLFDRDEKTIRRHVNNIFSVEELNVDEGKKV